MNYLDLFSGIGGFTLGLQQAGFKFDWLGHSETDKYANQIYEKHYPESEALGDVKTIKTNRLPKIHLITFGFPCQDLSIAGKRGGLRAKRSSLFFEAMRIVRDTRPDHFIFENVKGLFSSNGGYDWFTVLKEIADSRYDGQWQLLNTRWFLPQNRERIYFVGHIRGRSRPKIFPIGESIEAYTENNEQKRWDRLESPYSLAIRGGARQRYDGETLIQVGNTNPSGKGQAGNVYDADGIMPSLCSGGDNPNRNRDVGYNFGKVAIRWQRSEKGKQARRKSQKKGKDYTPFNEEHRELVLSEDNVSGCVTNALNKDALLSCNTSIRRLTPIECERLQGFPNNWTEGISDTQRYKCLGNACSVPVVKAVGERLL